MPANAPLAFLLEPPPPPAQQTQHAFGSARLYRRRRNRMSASATSPHDLQSHLYQSFLDGKTTDVALRVTGSWSATYHLHRVVLIQSGFFRSLFLTSGFAESSPKSPRTRASFQDELNVVFDDQNITRAAFELCIARLYGGGPPLFVSPALQPTLKHPLTPGFPFPSDADIPEGNQPATPDFVLSLLATAIYLSIPSIASQALSIICGTIGPYTVTQYLDFALGSSRSVYSQESAVGLDNVADMAETISDEEFALDASLSREPSQQSKGRRSPSPELLSGNSPTGSFERISSLGGFHSSEPLSFHYGAVSDKIGEAAASWLARWGPDMLEYEEGGDILQPTTSLSTARRRSSTMPSSAMPPPPPTSGLSLDTTSLTPTIPHIWRRGGLSAPWIKALIASDSFFVRDERARYEFAKRVVELRRRQPDEEDEEQVWTELFEHAIYYCNMPPEEMIALAEDISPTTGRPYISLNVLQSANWSHTVLKHQITANRSQSPTSSPPASPPAGGKHLGLAQPNASTTPSRPHFLIPRDETLRIGEHGGPSSESKGISMEELFAHSHAPFASDVKPSSEYPITFNETSFFGLSAKPSKSPNDTYSTHPPYRFSVEFFDVDALQEKQRLHSRTIWYAGSLFNVYLQVVKKTAKSAAAAPATQLGIYVCRQSTVEAVPAVSAPNPSVTRRGRENVQNGATPTLHHVSSNPTMRPAHAVVVAPSAPLRLQRTTTPVSSIARRPPTSSSLPNSESLPTNVGGGSPGPASAVLGSPNQRDEFGYAYSLPYTVPGAAPVQPYRDSRPNVMAYFMVYAASATGNSQTRFKSAPDQFKISQSWGWKSSSLRGDDVPAGEEDGKGKSSGQAEKVSLRATVVIGVV